MRERNGPLNFGKFTSNYPLDIITGILMLVGVILSFFHLHVGGLLVGLATGIFFCRELRDYFLTLRKHYAQQGIFKTLMIIGVIIYFLIAIPAFVIAALIGFAAMYLFRYAIKKL